MTITVGTQVRTSNLGAVHVAQVLGEGGEGRVFRVVTDSGEEYALKWYKAERASPEQWTALHYLMDRGSPDDRFVWPLSVVGNPQTGFGYVMPLCPSDYLGLNLYARGEDASGRRLSVRDSVIVELCHQLATSFLRLHAQGMCYRDISLANTLFSPRSGDILICDVDNVGIDDGTGRVLGTGRFMAPEIVRDPDQQMRPSILTDRHSLAVLLFVTLFREHPLEGEKTHWGICNEKHQLEHFGRDPVFSLHPTDARNRPVAEHVRRYWDDVYPEFLRRLFTRAFVDGVVDPQARVGEAQWCRALSRLKEVLGACPACAEIVYHDPEAPGRDCWWCHAPLPPPQLLTLQGRQRVVGDDLLVTARLAGKAGPEVIGRGVHDPADPARFGLHNVGQTPWTATFADGDVETVAPGRAVILEDGMSLRLPDDVALVSRGFPGAK